MLVVPTSVFGMVLLPIAYFIFFMMINNKSLMGTSLPQGNKRIGLNIAMGIALVAATIGAGYSIWAKAGLGSARGGGLRRVGDRCSIHPSKTELIEAQLFLFDESVRYSWW